MCYNLSVQRVQTNKLNTPESISSTPARCSCVPVGWAKQYLWAGGGLKVWASFAADPCRTPWPGTHTVKGACGTASRKTRRMQQSSKSGRSQPQAVAAAPVGCWQQDV
jgi:hypothetical protein